MDSDGLITLFLTDRDEPCPLCGYNLRNLVGNRCPECGDELLLRVNTAEPRLAAAITGLIGISSGAGLNVLLLIYGLIVTLRDRRQSGLVAFFRCNTIGAVVEGAALYLWLRSWRNLRRARGGTRWALALGCWLLTLANLVYFTMNVK
jgi:predicted RNA-binding Zn-ribbon protein involved in translation (DUF1610 family)